MGRKDVGRALEAMQDSGVREQLSAGNIDALGPELELTDEERVLVVGAAADYPGEGLENWVESADKLVNSFTGAAYYSIGALSSARIAFT